MKQAMRKDLSRASTNVAHLRRDDAKLARELLGAERPPARHGEPRVVDAHGLAALFDRLRNLSPEGPGFRLVLAPVAQGTAMASLASALTMEAERARFRTLLMSCAEAHGGLALGISDTELRRQRDIYGVVPTSLLGPILWTPTAGNGDGAVRTAMSDARRTHDLVIVVGPALAQCPDSAHLARACDGLVLVAQAQTTTKDELRAAADNAHISGCPVLGILYAEATNWLSSLLRKL
jgi:hypothetical protein